MLEIYRTQREILIENMKNFDFRNQIFNHKEISLYVINYIKPDRVGAIERNV